MLRSRTGMLAIPPGLMRWIFGVALAASLLAIGCNGPDSRVRGAIQAGDEAARQRALREALNHYRTAAVAEPASLEAQTRRGAMAELLGEFDEALDAYGRASRLRSSALAYYRAGAMADRMGNTVLATEYLNASMQALPTRGERWAQTGQRAIERLITSLDGSRWARMLPDWVFRSLHLSRVALANAVLDREVVAAALFTTLLEAGETERALEVARGRGWVREGTDYCAATRGAVGAETRALVGMLAAPERADCLLPLGRALTDGGLVRLSRRVLQGRIRACAARRRPSCATACPRMRCPRPPSRSTSRPTISSTASAIRARPPPRTRRRSPPTRSSPGPTPISAASTWISTSTIWRSTGSAPRSGSTRTISAPTPTWAWHCRRCGATTRRWGPTAPRSRSIPRTRPPTRTWGAACSA